VAFSPHMSPQNEPLVSPICATRPAHFSLLHLITRMLFGEVYRA
jgi:hypothetical protein